MSKHIPAAPRVDVKLVPHIPSAAQPIAAPYALRQELTKETREFFQNQSRFKALLHGFVASEWSDAGDLGPGFLPP